jgi:hypothetical protein
MTARSKDGNLRVWQALLLILVVMMAFLALLYGCSGDPNCPSYNNNDYNNNTNNNTNNDFNNNVNNNGE